MVQVPQLAERFLQDIEALNANLRAKYSGLDLSSSASSLVAYGEGDSAREARDIDLLCMQLEEFYERHCPDAVLRARQVALMYHDDIGYVLRGPCSHS